MTVQDENNKLLSLNQLSGHKLTLWIYQQKISQHTSFFEKNMLNLLRNVPQEFHDGDRSMNWFPDKERKFPPKCEEKMFLVELKEKTPFAGLIVVLPLPQLLFQGSTELWWESTRRRMKLGAKSNFLFYFNQQQQSRIPEHNLAGKIQYVTTLFVGADNCIICPICPAEA